MIKISAITQARAEELEDLLGLLELPYSCTRTSGGFDFEVDNRQPDQPAGERTATMASFENHAKQILEFGGALTLAQPGDIREKLSTIQMNVKKARMLASGYDGANYAATIVWTYAQNEENDAVTLLGDGYLFSAYHHYQAAMVLYQTVLLMEVPTSDN